MDVVLRPLEDAVLVDIPRLHAVCSRRTGVEQVNDLICAPWPEHSRVQSIVNTQIDLYLWGHLGGTRAHRSAMSLDYPQWRYKACKAFRRVS